jgi:hypothetical protein
MLSGRTLTSDDTITCKLSVYILSVECSRTKNNQPSIINVQVISTLEVQNIELFSGGFGQVSGIGNLRGRLPESD